MVPSCHPHLFWNRIAPGDSTSRGLSCAVIPSSFLELDCFPWFDFPCLGCTVMTASFLELDCFRWFKSLHFEWHCHAFLFLELFCSYCLSGTVMPSSFGKWLLPVPGLPTIEWCCHTIFIFSGTVMLSSSLETVWFQWFNFLRFASSTSTSYSSSVAVTPSSLWEKKQNNLLQVIWLPTVWVVLCHTYFS